MKTLLFLAALILPGMVASGFAGGYAAHYLLRVSGVVHGVALAGSVR